MGTDRQMDGWTDRHTETDGQMDTHTDGWMDEQTDRHTDGWTDKQTYIQRPMDGWMKTD